MEHTKHRYVGQPIIKKDRWKSFHSFRTNINKANNISRNTSIGLNLIQKAADGGYSDAIQWQKERKIGRASCRERV